MTPLQKARERQNLSQHQLAEMARVQQGTISKVEAKKLRPSRTFAERVAAVLSPGITELEILYPERFATDEEAA